MNVGSMNETRTYYSPRILFFTYYIVGKYAISDAPYVNVPLQVLMGDGGAQEPEWSLNVWLKMFY